MDDVEVVCHILGFAFALQLSIKPAGYQFQSSLSSSHSNIKHIWNEISK